MKRVKMLKDFGVWKKGIQIIDNSRAKFFCRKRIDWDYYEKTGRIKLVPMFAVELKDLGLHYGNSKSFYIIGGKSKVNK